jgi:hypothetical protein
MQLKGLIIIIIIIIITGRRFQANLPLAWETKREENSMIFVVEKHLTETDTKTEQSTCRTCAQTASTNCVNKSNT